MAKKVKKLLEAITLAVGLLATASTMAKADEELIASNQRQQLLGQQTVRVADYLNLWRQRAGRVNSVIIVASTARGMGQLDVVYQGRSITQRRVGTMLESIQVQVQGDPRYGQDANSLEIRTQGNFTIAMIGVTVETGGWDDGRGRPGRPGYPDRPSDRPGDRPGYPNQPGYNYVSQAEVDAFIRDLHGASFDDKRVSLVRQYQQYWGSKMIVMQQLTGILREFSFDDGRLTALRTLKANLIVDAAQLDQVLSVFSFQSSRDQARQILLAR